MSWNLVALSFAMILRNPGVVIRISLVPFALALLLTGLGWALLGVGPQAMARALALGLVETSVTIALALAAVLIILAMAWSSIAWHRFVLRAEVPGIMPEFVPPRIGSYALRSTLISVLLLVMLFPLSAIGLQMLGALGLLGFWPGQLAIAFGVATLMVFLWVRLTLILPAVALGQPLTIAESWAATATRTDDILRAAAILAALELVFSGLLDLAPFAVMLALVLRLLLMWILTLAGAGLLSLFYGELIERRHLH